MTRYLQFVASICLAIAGCTAAIATERPSEIHKAFYCAGMIWPLALADKPEISRKYSAIQSGWNTYGYRLLAAKGLSDREQKAVALRIMKEGLADLKVEWTDFKQVPFYGEGCLTPPRY